MNESSHNPLAQLGLKRVFMMLGRCLSRIAGVCSPIVLISLSLLVWGISPSWADGWADRKMQLMEDPDFMPGMSAENRDSLIRHLKLWSAPAVPAYKLQVDALKSRVVNIDHLPAVWSQNSQPTCTYWAMVYYQLTWQEAKRHGWIRPHPLNDPDKVMSPQFVIDLGSMYDVVKYLGCGTWESYANQWDDNTRLPTRAGFATARLHRARDFYLLPADPDEAIADLKQRLADGEIVATSLSISNYFTNYTGADGPGVNNTVLFEDGGGNWGAHALTFIGYDDNLSYNTGTEVKTGAFLLVNSWGAWGHTLPEAGSAGFIWIGYDYAVEHNLVANSVIMEAPTSDVDKNFVRFGVDHDAFIELNSKIIVGNPYEPEETIALRNLFGNRGIHQSFDLGIDRLIETKSMALRLSVLDEDVSGGMLGDELHTGFITDFSVKLDGVPTTWTTDALPVPTVDCRNLGDATERKEKTFIFDLSAMEEKPTHSTFNFTKHNREVHPHDFNADGFPDLLVGPQWEILLNNGSGGFSPLPVTGLQLEYQIADLADFNHDGQVDLLVRVEDDDDPELSYFTVFYAGAILGQFTDSGFRFRSETGLGNASVVDFDQDGYMDLSTGGWEPSGKVTTPDSFRLWHNNGDGTFSDSGLRLPYNDCGRSPMAWGDFTGDGRPDLVIVQGFHSDPLLSSVEETVIVMENDGNGGLIERQRFRAYRVLSLHLVDLTGDGRLDIAVARDLSYGELELYEDDGTGYFVALPHNLENLRNVVSISFGDIDNDGLCDMALLGQSHTNAYLNAGQGQFRYLAGLGEPLALGGDVALADFDADGDLDWVAQGYFFDNYWSPRFHFFEGLAADAKRLNRPNAAPPAPSIQNASYDSATQRLTIEWTASEDDTTPLTGLNWRLRLGSFPGKSDLMPADLDLLPIAFRPNIDETSGRYAVSVKIPFNQPVFAQVQAVDNGGANSEWSASLEILPEGVASLCDVNADGTVDVADIVSLLQSMQSEETQVQAAADLNSDGRVTALDKTVLISRILSRPAVLGDAIDIIPVTSKGAEWGDKYRQLSFPEGWTAQPLVLTISPSVAASPWESQLAEHFFRIDGIPTSQATPFTVRINAPGEKFDEARLVIGCVHTPTSVWEPMLVWRAYAPVAQSGDWLEFEIPGNIFSAPATARSMNPVSTEANEYSLEVQTNIFGMVNGITRAESSHFMVDYPSTLAAAPIIAMLDALEWTYDTWKNTYGMSFDTSSRFSGKTSVQVQKLASNYDGYYDSFFNNVVINDLFVENTAPLDEARHIFTTVHEFSHKVLQCYAPFISGSNEYATLWAEEASCVWMETVYKPAKLPDVCSQNMVKIFQMGMPMLRRSSADQQNYGYGMATLLHELVTRQVQNDFMKKLWQGIQSGQSVVAAVVHAKGSSTTDWWTPFMQELVANNVLPFGWSDIDTVVGSKQVDTKSFTINELDSAQAHSFTFRIDDLSGTMLRTIIDNVRLTDDMVLSHRLSWSGSRVELSAFQQELPATVNIVGEGAEVNKVIKLDVPLTEMLSSDKWRVLSLLTTPDEHLDSYDTGLFSGTSHPGFGIATLEVAVTKNKKWDFPSPNLTRNGGYGVALPTFDSLVSIEGPGIVDVEFYNVDNGTPLAGNILLARSFAVPPVNYVINVSANCQTNTYVDGSTSYVVGPVKSYIMKYEPEEYRNPPVLANSVSSDNGQFTLPLSTTSTYLSAQLYAVYDVTVNSTQGTEIIEDVQSSVGMLVIQP